VPPALDPVLERMLAADPRRRYQTADDVIAALADTDLACADAEYTEFVALARGAAPPPATELPTRVDFPAA
jgi:hypothetical protein